VKNFGINDPRTPRVLISWEIYETTSPLLRCRFSWISEW